MYLQLNNILFGTEDVLTFKRHSNFVGASRKTAVVWI